MFFSLDPFSVTSICSFLHQLVQWLNEIITIRAKFFRRLALGLPNTSCASLPQSSGDRCGKSIVVDSGCWFGLDVIWCERVWQRHDTLQICKAPKSDLDQLGRSSIPKEQIIKLRVQFVHSCTIFPSAFNSSTPISIRVQFVHSDTICPHAYNSSTPLSDLSTNLGLLESYLMVLSTLRMSFER